MRKIASTDKFRISLLAISMALAGCGDQRDFQVVSVETHRERATEHLEGTRGCHAIRVRDIPAIRTFKSGRVEEYEISEVIELVDVCK